MKSKQDLKKLYQEKINHFRKLHHIHIKGTDIPDPIDTWVELVSKELNPLAAILHVYAGGLNFMK